MAAPNPTNVTLELGGNDPAIIPMRRGPGRGGVRLYQRATFMTSGQVCMAVKRLQSVLGAPTSAEVVDGLRATLAGTRVGPGLDAETTMGLLNTQRQRDYVADLCDEARGRVAPRCSPGEIIGEQVDGNYLPPSPSSSTWCAGPGGSWPRSSSGPRCR